MRKRYMSGTAAAVVLVAVNTSPPAPSGNWPAYLGGPQHISYNNAEKVINPANVSKLVLDWRFVGAKATLRGQPPPGFVASPTIYGNAVYIGSQTGWFYKLNVLTGRVMAKRFIGFVAMYASNLKVRWRSVIAISSKKVADYYQWASPTVSHGAVYVGISSFCDKPLVRGGLTSFNQDTGARLARFYSLPRSLLGGSVWSSAAVGSAGDVYISTGNPQNGVVNPAFSDAIVQLAPRGLRPLASFVVPKAQVVRDGDFGASPTLFGRYVGACDKNGIFYALTRYKLRLAWSKRIGAPASRSLGFGRCISAAAYDGKHLYIGGDEVRVHGKAYLGSLTELNPNTGHRVWVTGLPNGVLGAPSLDGAGVVAVGTYDFTSTPNAVYLISAATGRILRKLITGGFDFAQSVFADRHLFTANDTGLYAWGLPVR